ncbi:zinc-binding dehydrogenase [Salinispora pacifica]|uniref:zinc-binding dehydrogenase n=1 Tax=Salinispora pacifica TaxID=351187 RepID=UPI00036E34E9|nr:zinc-binding dehydrogenase [Salinispora pacifica]
MRAVAAMRATTDPSAGLDSVLSGLRVGNWPDPEPPSGWTTVRVRAAGVNHHDLWTLRGIGIAHEQLPVVLGAEAAGIDDEGREVLVYPVIGTPTFGDETLDPACRYLSVDHDGTFAEWVAVPRECLVPKPPELSWEEAACLPGAWLTAYRMLFEKAGLRAGATVLVQGAGGGVASALVTLGAAAGYRVWVTSRDARRRDRAAALGADRVYPPGARLPDRVDAVMETVGAATWEHSLRALRPGGRVVVSGATTGTAIQLDLGRLFYRQLSVVGSTMGTREQLVRLVRFCAETGVRPTIDRHLDLADAAHALRALARGEVFGKVVLRP